MSQICQNCQTSSNDEAFYCANCGKSLKLPEQSQGKTEEELINLANQGNREAQVELGNIYLEKEHYTEALKLYRKAAEQGDMNAQNAIGVMYENGTGMQQDYYEAVRWYRKAAEQGLAIAQMNLSAMYLEGRGTQQNCHEAYRWLQKAAEQGLAGAQYNFGVMYQNGYCVQQNSYEAFKWLQKAAEQGFAEAQSNLAIMYLNGYGVELNYDEAYYWFRQAAEKGHVGAYNDIGFMYHNGKGVEENYDEAIRWYKKAAEQGHTLAQENLALILKEPKDLKGKTEDELINIANQGNRDAQVELGGRYSKKEHYTEAFKWYKKAAEQGNAYAQGIIGVMYIQGSYVQQDYYQGVIWLRKAAEQGNRNAQDVLGKIGITNSNHNSGCFIATAVYNSPTAPKVMILREFRDQKLLTNALGEAFVRFYYKYSPPIAKFLSIHRFLSEMVRVAFIEPLVWAVRIFMRK